VNGICLRSRQGLETGAAEDREVRAHLAECASCRAHAALLEVLGRLAPGEASEEAVGRIMAALPPAPWQRRRLAAWLPLAAGLALAVVGLVLSGGIPAPGVMSTLPAAAGGVLGWIVSSVLDTLAVARGGTDAARAMVATGGFSLLLWLAAAAVCGSWAVVALVGRTRGGGRS
jgi:anti-sigma factor RsiW